ncbi:exopolysaccharide synthesis, ExoD family protein [Hydrogenophaga sp. RAC07]|uniref:exopolysaccharide biosynthesis protein n=1 Tax=Hydrogenophaga sp. RAC07 TaxID=1842537 RepID=UPI00083DD765|nr:exopolysaccharide biosynthesis protein [Hydrogenophaga sp. RAC07]AOF87764.1 exopolysaccharide synthesis, ExoD family protein [Hydrogenophaga sp. RAC07]
MSSTDVAVQARQGNVPLSLVLFRLANDNSRERISVGDLLAALGDRAIGALMFFFAAPNILPVPPGVSTLLGAPLLFLSAQLMLGMRPWLPGVITRRSISRDDLATLVRRIVPWLAKAEKLLKPRASVLVRPPVEYFVGLVCLVLAAILMLPVPLGNTLPALAISLLALGVLERDGVWIGIGLLASAVAGVVVSGVVWAMIKATVYLLARLMS